MKGVNCVHNDKITSNGLERSNLGTQCNTINQEIHGFQWNPCFDVVLLKVEWEMCFLWILTLNLPKIWRFLAKICGFCSFCRIWAQYLSKSMDFSQNLQILWISREKLIFLPWKLSLDWELMNNFLVLNQKTSQNLQEVWMSAKICSFCRFWAQNPSKTVILQFL